MTVIAEFFKRPFVLIGIKAIVELCCTVSNMNIRGLGPCIRKIKSGDEGFRNY